LEKEAAEKASLKAAAEEAQKKLFEDAKRKRDERRLKEKLNEDWKS